MMSKKAEFEKMFLELVETELLGQSEADLIEIYSSENIEDTVDYKATKSLIDAALSKHRKNKLLTARAELDSVRDADHSDSFAVQNAKEFIIRLMLNDRLPEGLTLAFREGQDIPDDEVGGIIQDLRELGIDIDDE